MHVMVCLFLLHAQCSGSAPPLGWKSVSHSPQPAEPKIFQTQVSWLKLTIVNKQAEKPSWGNESCPVFHLHLQSPPPLHQICTSLFWHPFKHYSPTKSDDSAFFILCNIYLRLSLRGGSLITYRPSFCNYSSSSDVVGNAAPSSWVDPDFLLSGAIWMKRPNCFLQLSPLHLILHLF